MRLSPVQKDGNGNDRDMGKQQCHYRYSPQRHTQ